MISVWGISFATVMIIFISIPVASSLFWIGGFVLSVLGLAKPPRYLAIIGLVICMLFSYHSLRNISHIVDYFVIY